MVGLWGAREAVLMCVVTVPAELGEVKCFKRHDLAQRTLRWRELLDQESSNFFYKEPDNRNYPERNFQKEPGNMCRLCQIVFFVIFCFCFYNS